MSKLAELQKATEALTRREKQDLILFLAARLRSEGPRLPEPRRFSREEIDGWIAEDEADLRRFTDAPA